MTVMQSREYDKREKKHTTCRPATHLRDTDMLELGVRWYTVVYILDVYIECLPRVS
jgi:hypothetical protein